MFSPFTRPAEVSPSQTLGPSGAPARAGSRPQTDLDTRTAHLGRRAPGLGAEDGRGLRGRRTRPNRGVPRATTLRADGQAVPPLTPGLRPSPFGPVVDGAGAGEDFSQTKKRGDVGRETKPFGHIPHVRI